jgi:NMD protein affecting ribosome stability and mRNA decay
MAKDIRDTYIEPRYCAQCGIECRALIIDGSPGITAELCDRCREQWITGKWPNLLDGLAEALEEDIEP